MAIREYVDGGQVIRVRGLTQDTESTRTWTYAWHGTQELQVGDELILELQINKKTSREWEVYVVELGSEYKGKIQKIGGPYGLKYPVNW